MELHEGARTVEAPQSTVSKYALSQGILKSRNIIETYRNTASLFGYAIFATWLLGGIWVAVNLPHWIMNSAALTLPTYIIGAGLLGYGMYRGINSFGFYMSAKIARKALPGDPLVARVSSDLGVPEQGMIEAFETMLVSYKGKTEVLYGDQLVTLKLKSKWDDIISADVEYLKVRRELVHTVASTLIKL